MVMFTKTMYEELKKEQEEVEKMAIKDMFNRRSTFIDASTHSGKANLDPSLYSEDGMPVRKDETVSVMGDDGLPQYVVKPAKTSDDAMDKMDGLNGYTMMQKYGAGMIAKPIANGNVQATTSVPRARKFMFPRIPSLGNEGMLEIVYTTECDEILDMIQHKLLEMAKENRKPSTMLMGKQQYRQYMAAISYQQQAPTIPKTIADAVIVVMDQEHYFDIVPSVNDMITHKL